MDKKKLLTAFNFLLAAMFLALLLIITKLKFTNFNTTIKQGIFIIILVVTVSAVFFNKLERHINLKLIYIFASALYLILQIIIAVSIDYVPVTDAAYLDLIARNYVQGDISNLYSGLNEIHDHYLARYENQWGIFIILSTYYKLLDAVLGYIPQQASVVLNIIAFQISLLFSFLIGCEVFEKKQHKLIVLILILCHPVFYTYTCYFYTDSVSMPFVAISVYALIRLIKSDSEKSFRIWLIICSLAIAIGFAIKGSVAIILVAALIICFLSFKLKKMIKITAVLLASLFIISTINSAIIYSNKIVTKEETNAYKFPAVHWVMMGLNGRGGYNHDDFLYTYGYDTVEEKSQANIRMIKQRMSDMGVKGFVSHIEEKSIYTWANAMFLSTHILSKSPESDLKAFFCKSKNFHDYCFIVHLMIMVFAFISTIKSCIKRDNYKLSYLYLILIGVVLFFLIWETRSRYIVNFIPLLLITTADGIIAAGNALLKLINIITAKVKTKA